MRGLRSIRIDDGGEFGDQCLANPGDQAELELEGFPSSRDASLGIPRSPAEDIVLVDGDFRFVDDEDGEQKDGDKAVAHAEGLGAEKFVKIADPDASIRSFLETSQNRVQRRAEIQRVGLGCGKEIDHVPFLSR